MSRPSTDSRVQREIKQSRPFRSRRQEAAIALLRTADQVRWLYTTALEPHGLTLPQYNVLRILRGAGGSGLPTMEIRERMVERSPGVTRLVDRLASRGWARRRSSAEDRRQIWVEITSRGLELVDRLDAVVQRVDEAALRALDDEAIESLVAALDAVRCSLVARTCEEAGP